MTKNAISGVAIKYSSQRHSDLGRVVRWPTHTIMAVGNIAWNISAAHFKNISAFQFKESQTNQYPIFPRSAKWVERVARIIGAHPETVLLPVILRSKATKNLMVTTGAVEILRGVYPESIEGLRMTFTGFLMGTN